MITLGVLCQGATDLRREDVEDWIARRWVRPEDMGDDEYLFEEIDVARVRLIQLLRRELRLDVAALPVVLSLLDQLHDTRRMLAAIGTGMEGELRGPQR